MGKDDRGIERGKCKVADCDCDEFEVKEGDLSCQYCGDPPARHQALNLPAKRSSPSDIDELHHEQGTNLSGMRQTPAPWQDVKLGWIPNPKRITGLFYNELMPKFYKSLWKFYPDIKTYRNAFITERKRQFDVTSHLSRLQDKLVKFKSGKNEAAAGKYLENGYVPKPHDSSRLTELVDYLDIFILQSANEIEKSLKAHDNTLFLQDSQTLKSGRDCHHLFNETTITKVIDFKVECLETKTKLEQNKKCTDDIFKGRFVFTSKKRNKKDYDNKWKIKKRKLTRQDGNKGEALSGGDQMELKYRNLFKDLGGTLGANKFYCPEQGVNQITELNLKDLTMQVEDESKFLILKELHRCECFRGEALNNVEFFISAEMF